MDFFWIVTAILFFSTLTRSAVGFGDALIAMPLLTILVGAHTATPLIALVATTISIGILINHWKEVEFLAAIPLILSSLAGIPVGLFYLKTVPDTIINIVLAAVIFFYALYNLVSPGLWMLKNNRLALPVGFIAGILGGAYNTNGPPVIIYGAMRRWKVENFRATLQGYFLFSGGSIMVAHGLAGLWTPVVLHYYLYTLPAVLLAIYLGGVLHKRIPREKFLPLVNILLILISALLVYSTLRK
jgi:uncharacterized membrane protein YfcA